MALSLKSKYRPGGGLTHSPITEMDEDVVTPASEGPYVTRENTRSRAEVGALGMGSKKASLYLSRTASLVQPGRESRASSRSGTPKQEDASSKNGDKDSSSDKTSVFSLQKEFTFTGYDIMADVEPQPTQPKKTTTDDSDEEKYRRTNTDSYLNACRMLGQVPVNYVARHINDKNMVMKSHPLGPPGTRAVCIALVNNRFVESIDFEDNDLGADGAVSVAEMLRDNDVITEVRIAENLIGSRGAHAFTELLKDGKHLHTLDITGSGLEDSDSKYVADMIEFNPHLRVLNVSHNRLSEHGAIDIGRAIAINDTLQELDLSWNHIRGHGATAVSIGLQRNVALKKINLSWNGFAKHGAEGLGRALAENRTLRELDVSNNRLGMKAVPLLIKGLQENDGLDMLRIGQNPFSPEVAYAILKAIGESEKCVLTKLDLSDIVVRTDFIKEWDEIKSKRPIPLRIMFGAIVKSVTAPAKDPDALDWRDPVVRMFKFMHDEGYRVIDLLKKWDKDGNFSVDREEFKRGFQEIKADIDNQTKEKQKQAENSLLTAAQLDELVDRLDTDGDGEVDLGELLSAEKDFRRKMHLRIRKLAEKSRTAADKVDSVINKLKRIEEL
ncbi:leucine-rich repeat-containing protein 74B-like isoform X2 [Mya arenaria]|uniref:leucine-rich repeat-containing protein 74B-like isoform X2 n=1 Tax=Mya arenaria TaxID=6604 RepID=UPI0022E3337E|nr:leucine-rich repeat-containing protein 74B-like isoform X2 [Mya arenaria]